MCGHHACFHKISSSHIRTCLNHHSTSDTKRQFDNSLYHFPRKSSAAVSASSTFMTAPSANFFFPPGIGVIIAIHKAIHDGLSTRSCIALH